MIKIALFCSGSGSNAEKIIGYFKGHPQIKVEILLSNNPKAYALERAALLGVPSQTFTRTDLYESGEVVSKLKDLGVSWVVLAGFLWLVPQTLLDAFPDRIINIHPALLPKFGGHGMYGMRVHQAVVDAQETESGISIHRVNPLYDEGHILFQARCVVDKTDTPETVAKKVQALEHEHFPKVIEKIITDTQDLTGQQ